MMATILNTSMLADIFHGFPHLDFNFENTTRVFSPSNVAYQQALMFNGIYLFFVTLCLFLIFGFYFLVASCYFYGNCSSQILKPRPSRSKALRILIGFFGICSSAALGVAFYGNGKAKEGIQSVAESALNIYNTFDLYKFKNNDVVPGFLKKASEQISSLEEKLPLNQSLPSLTQISTILSKTQLDLESSGNLLKDAGVDLKDYAGYCTEYNDIRWWIYTTFLCFHLLMVLVMLYATYTNRKCALIVMTTMAVFSLLLIMSIISISVPLSIGAADICRQPKQAYLQYVDDPAAKVLVQYYMECKIGNNQLFINYEDASKQLEAAFTLVHSIEKVPVVGKFPEVKVLLVALENGSEELKHLIRITDCSNIHTEYQNTLRAVCTTTLEGFGLLILSALITSVFLTATLLCITPLWKAIAPLRPILKKHTGGVHIVTESYQGPPGYGATGSESFHGSSSFDASYKSIDDPEDFEHVPLISKRSQPHSYRAVHGSTEFLSVEEDRREQRQQCL